MHPRAKHDTGFLNTTLEKFTQVLRNSCSKCNISPRTLLFCTFLCMPKVGKSYPWRVGTVLSENCSFVNRCCTSLRTILICLPRLPFWIPRDNSQIKQEFLQQTLGTEILDTTGRMKLAVFLPQQNYSEKPKHTPKSHIIANTVLSMFNHGLQTKKHVSGFLPKQI